LFIIVPEHSTAVSVPVEAFTISSVFFRIKPGAVVPISPGDFNLAVKAEIGTTLDVSVPSTVSASVPNSTTPLFPVVAFSQLITANPGRVPKLIPSPSLHKAEGRLYETHLH